MAHQPHAGGRGQGEGAALTRAASDTIAAVATPAGRGGIGVVRVSGPLARAIAQAVAGGVPRARHAHRADFRAADGSLIDQGIALFFPAPHSYTGEDVLELQAHGGPVLMGRLLERCRALGARLAQPGEFTRRAFLNDRMDLAQAEAVADLIDAASEEAARGAARSLCGEFSRHVNDIAAGVLELRMHLEACIDFPEEEIDPADRAQQAARLAAIERSLGEVLATARQGAVLREGLTVVLAGSPNVGKSSLLNRLAGEDLAIVSATPGTTRDYVRATIAVDGVPLHLVDTAGLRQAVDEVERIGVERTTRAMQTAGAVVWVESPGDADAEAEAFLAHVPDGIPVARVVNKADLLPAAAAGESTPGLLHVSARTGAGIDGLRAWLLEAAGWRSLPEGVFMARQRHVVALREALDHVQRARNVLQQLELAAEEARLAHRALGRITGEVSADELLGEIFGRFCIGK